MLEEFSLPVVGPKEPLLLGNLEMKDVVSPIRCRQLLGKVAS